MQAKIRNTTLVNTTRVAAVALGCSVLGAVLATAFDAQVLSASPMFAAFGGVMTAVYQRDRALPLVESKPE